MRWLAALLAIAALAIGLAILARSVSGYVQIVSPPLRIETSLTLFVVGAVAAFVGFYALLRVASRIAALPREVRAHRARQQVERARAKQDAALVALLEGRYGRVLELSEQALAAPRSGGLAALVGARAAIDVRDYRSAEKMLGRADARVPSLAVPRMMLEAELALERGQPGLALDRLDELRREAGSHTAAQRLALRALGAAGRPEAIPAVVDQLVKRKVYDAEQGAMLKASAYADVLAALAGDESAFREAWERLPDADRAHPKVALAAARALRGAGRDREAAEALERSLELHWEPALLLAYAECRPGDPAPQLEAAERWLAAHSQDATLLHALGRLCEQARLWGKAQTYYEASLALDDHWRTRVMLGSMLARLGRPAEANPQLAAALDLALAELGEPRR